jgi:TRAP transporter TAXI family solute receptor
MKVTCRVGLLVYVVCLFILSLALSSVCFAGEAPAHWPKDLPFGCKSKTGSYVAATSICEMINKYVPGVNAHPATYVTDSAFPSLLRKGEILLATGSSSTQSKMVRGLGDFKGKRHVPGVRTIFAGEGYYYMVVAGTKTGINKIKDIEGKTFMSQLGGSVGFKDAREATLKIFNIPKDKITVLSFSKFSELPPAVREGKTKSVGSYVTLAASWIQDLTMTNDAKILPWNDDELKQMGELVPGFVKGAIPANTYKGQPEPIKTPVSIGYYNCYETLPDDLAYAITAAVYDHFDEFQSYFKLADKFKLPETIDPERITIPYHPGAIKYYREKGFWTPAHDAKQKEILRIVTGKK